MPAVQELGAIGVLCDLSCPAHHDLTQDPSQSDSVKDPAIEKGGSNLVGILV